MTTRPTRPTIAQIREVSQPLSVTGRSTSEHWIADLYQRRISPYLTRILLRTLWLFFRVQRWLCTHHLVVRIKMCRLSNLTRTLFSNCFSNIYSSDRSLHSLISPVFSGSPFERKATVAASNTISASSAAANSFAVCLSVLATLSLHGGFILHQTGMCNSYHRK